jgi:acyl-CoA thioesterase FadM
MSWLWGLGFFFSIHATVQGGIAGFLMFAIPNCIGLAAFGWLLERLRQSGTLETDFKTVGSRFDWVFIGYQIVAIGLTLFAFSEYFWSILVDRYSIAALVVFAVVFAVVGYTVTIGQLANLHAITLLAGVACALVAIAQLFASPPPSAVPAAAGGGLALHMLIPMLVGFLLGPWLDLQQWQRAIAIARDGHSLKRTYTVAAVLFFALLSINATLAVLADPRTADLARVALDHKADFEAVVSQALRSGFAGDSLATIAFGIWVTLALGATVDSGCCALRWFLGERAAARQSPLSAFIPTWLSASANGPLLAAAGVALLATQYDISLKYFMGAFATFFVGYAALLVLWCLRRRVYDTPDVVPFLTGIMSAIIGIIGYEESSTLLLAIGSVLPLLSVAQVLRGLSGPQLVSGGLAGRDEPSARPKPPTAALSVAEHDDPPVPAPRAGAKEGRFEDSWFIYEFIATYNDTNSTGNVYFANYLAWVGKTRELFFRKAMPGFEVKVSPWLILTRSINHKFIREAREFDAIRVRLRFAKYNRKFVDIEHEIWGSGDVMLGRGEQTLMFVDAQTYALLDIPPEVYAAFIGYAQHLPGGSPAPVAAPALA